ncbi:MAG: SDR family oxidoreductase [Alphaproteobacteria bacterium]
MKSSSGDTLFSHDQINPDLLLMPRLFCFGLGYSALRLVEAVRANGWDVAGTCREEAMRDALRARGIEAHLFGGAHGALDPAVLSGATHLLHSIPPADNGDPVLAAHGGDIAAIDTLCWVGYLSATGVYGDRGGGWVDEDTPPNPGIARSHRRLAAERQWRDYGSAQAIPLHVFRLAGIYGPGRSALDQVRAGTARRLVKAGLFFSRIHVDDIVGVLRASMARPDPGAIYNVCDDEPAPATDVVAFACDLLGVAAPPEIPFAEAELSPMAQSFYAENRRVRNRRIKRDLGVALRYPDYRAGLKAVLVEQDG